MCFGKWTSLFIRWAGESLKKNRLKWWEVVSQIFWFGKQICYFCHLGFLPHGSTGSGYRWRAIDGNSRMSTASSVLHVKKISVKKKDVILTTQPEHQEKRKDYECDYHWKFFENYQLMAPSYFHFEETRWGKKEKGRKNRNRSGIIKTFDSLSDWDRAMANCSSSSSLSSSSVFFFGIWGSLDKGLFKYSGGKSQTSSLLELPLLDGLRKLNKGWVSRWVMLQKIENFSKRGKKMINSR